MQILVFSRKTRSIIKTLTTLAGEGASVARVPDEISCRRALAGCMDGESILVFFITDPADMAFLETQAREFIDMKLIIFLENHDPELADRAYRLKPRLVIDSRDSPALLPGAVEGILSSLMAFKKKVRS